MTTARTRAPRTASDVARGAGALAVVLLLLVGIPTALTTVTGAPVPRTLPSLDTVGTALTTPDDGRLFLLALTGVAWLGWATFAAAVVVEAVAQLRGRPPVRLPVMGPQQQLARRLVTAIAVVLSAPVLVALPPAHATGATPPAPPTAAPAHAERSTASAAADRRPAPAREVLVAPGDTLSGIAEDHLGDADRYPEIAQASRDLVQADGRRLVDPDLIYPGWHLHLPAALGPATPPTPPPPVQDERAVHPGPDIPPLAPEELAVGQLPAADPDFEASAPAPRASTSDTGPDSTDASRVHEAMVSTTVGLGALTAAGLVALVTRKRSRQQRHRRTGQRLPVPDDAVIAVEHRLRADQDPWTAADLDRALRALAVHSRARGTPLPAVRLARLTDQRIELHLAAPAPPVPPFTTTALGDTLWILDREDDQTPTVEAPDGPPPYPALTTLGRDLDGGTVLIDLEKAGALTVTAAADGWGEGDHDDTAAQAILAGMAVELATSAWAEEIQAHLVGVASDLVAAMDVERLDHSDDVERLLVELTAWADELRLALLAAGLDSAAAARSTGLVPDAWGTRVVLVGGRLTDAQIGVLQVLLTAEPRVPLAVVTTTGGTLDGSTLTTHRDADLATLHPEALTVVPQALPPEVYRHIAHMLITAGAATTAPPPVDGPTVAPTPSTPDVGVPELPHPVDRAGDAPPVTGTPNVGDGASTGEAGAEPRGPVVRVLGPVEITGARGHLSAESHRARITEVVAFLALHPHRDHYLLDEALWPGDRVPDGRRNQLLSRARRWLGTDDDGQPYVPIVNPDGYRLTADIITDWSYFLDLVGTSPHNTSTEDLHAALDLVRGQPFAGANPRRYGWADIDRQEMIAAVVDAAHEAAQRARHDGDAAAARRAAATGLLAEPGSEVLWRDALRAEWLAGDRASLEAMADRFTLLAEELGGDLEDETLHLLDELLRPRTTRPRPVPVGGGPDAP